MTKRFGAEYEAYRKQVPAWWPRLPRRTPDVAPSMTRITAARKKP